MDTMTARARWEGTVLVPGGTWLASSHLKLDSSHSGLGLPQLGKGQ